MPDDRHIAATDDCRLLARLDGDRLELAVAGELDMAATFRIEPEIDALLAEPGVRRLVWDLADVTFIDSAGLSVLLSVRERAERLGIRVTLARGSAPVQRVIDMSGTGAVFQD